jgi:hypothetical protein
MDDRTTYRTLSNVTVTVKSGLTNNHPCVRYPEKGESASYILCYCEATAYLRFRHLGHYFTEPGDYLDAFLSKVLHLIQSVALFEGGAEGDAQQIVVVHGLVKVCPLFIHSFMYTSSAHLCNLES